MFNSHEARVHRGYLGLGVTRAIGVHRCFFRAPGTPKLPSPSTPKGAEKWPFYAFLSEKRPKLPWNIFRWNFPPDFWYACVKRPKMQQKKTIFWSPILKIVLVKIWGVQNPSNMAYFLFPELWERVPRNSAPGTRFTFWGTERECIPFFKRGTSNGKRSWN